MTAPNVALLDPPGVLSVTGTDARKFLQGMITNDMDRLQSDGDAIHAALLGPQGKILFAFFVIQAGEGFLVETSRGVAVELAKRLTFYKLRAAVKIEDVSDRYGLAVAWGGSGTPASSATVTYLDSRHPALGRRLLAPASSPPAANASSACYHRHRVALGVPEAELDYPLGDTYPHEADFDLFHGTDFDKGCYVGQEVVARMQHKAVVRRRVVRVTGNAPLPAGQPNLLAGSVAVGRLGSVDGLIGLALSRLDRVAEALEKGTPLTAEGIAISVNQADLDAYLRAAAGKASVP